MMGRLIVLSGPSGVGKDTVLDALIARDPRIVRVVTYTTRKPRMGEVDGVHYRFVDKERFFELANAGHFFEYKNVYDDVWYASPRSDAESLERSGKFPVLKIDVEGAMDVIALRPDALTIMIVPPSIEELERRLRARASDSEAEVEARIAKAAYELSFADRYQHRIVNDRVESAAGRILALL